MSATSARSINWTGSEPGRAGRVVTQSSSIPLTMGLSADKYAPQEVGLECVGAEEFHLREPDIIPDADVRAAGEAGARDQVPPAVTGHVFHGHMHAATEYLRWVHERGIGV